MHRSLGLRAALAVCLFAWASSPAEAQTDLQDLGRKDAIGVVVGGAAILAGVGIGVYLIVQHNNHTISGCAAAADDGLQLQAGGGQALVLMGNIADLKPAERLRLHGRKLKKDAAGRQVFLVERVEKDFGSCNAPPPTP